jgi:hypothetical protein
MWTRDADPDYRLKDYHIIWCFDSYRYFKNYGTGTGTDTHLFFFNLDSFSNLTSVYRYLRNGTGTGKETCTSGSFVKK